MNVNNGEIKLIALDMDGTLLNNIHQISAANRLAIKVAQENGVKVVLSTGRSYQTCHEYADSLGLNSYLVTVNGSEIWDEQRKLIKRLVVKTELIEWMWRLSQQYQTTFWAINTERTWHNEMPEDLYSFEWMKFGFIINDQVIREKIFHELQSNGELEVSNSAPNNIEVNDKGVNKAKGLEMVCDRLGITMNHVMAVGDSLNDLAMIKEAGIGVAMGNAQEAVKQHADWVTADNEEDGVAKAIRKWVLK